MNNQKTQYKDLDEYKAELVKNENFIAGLAAWEAKLAKWEAQEKGA